MRCRGRMQSGEYGVTLLCVVNEEWMDVNGKTSRRCLYIPTRAPTVRAYAKKMHGGGGDVSRRVDPWNHNNRVFQTLPQPAARGWMGRLPWGSCRSKEPPIRLCRRELATCRLWGLGKTSVDAVDDADCCWM